MIGIQEKVLTPELASFLQQIRPAMIIFFARNIGSLKQFRKLTRDLKDLLGEDTYFAIDHEGGLIQRFSSPEDDEIQITPFPGNMALAKTNREDWAFEQGRLMALELLSIGLDLNLAPVLDVLTPDYNPGITIRSFGNDPGLVSKFGCAMIRGMQDYGLAASAKHFPGKGAATLDAHIDLPTIKLPREEMIHVHLKPFRDAVLSGVSFVMTSHVIYSGLEQDLPATFSRKNVHELLRETLNFQNVILSDDLEMGAILKRFPFDEAVVRCVEAGHDIILVCHQSDLILKAYQTLSKAYASGRLKEENLAGSVNRMDKVFRGLKSVRKISQSRNGWELARQISLSSVEVMHKGRFQWPEGEMAHLLLPQFLQVASRYYFEPALLEKKSFIESFLEKSGHRSHTHFTNIEGEPSLEWMGKIPAESPVILFVFDAHLFNAQKQALIEAQKYFRNLAVLPVRNPFDAAYIHENTSCIQTYGFRVPQIERALILLHDHFSVSKK